MRNDTHAPVEGKDFHYTSGSKEDYCRTKCNAASTCSGYEFDKKKDSCKHWSWAHSLRGNYTDYAKIFSNDNKTHDSNNTNKEKGPVKSFCNLKCEG